MRVGPMRKGHLSPRDLQRLRVVGGIHSEGEWSRVMRECNRITPEGARQDGRHEVKHILGVGGNHVVVSAAARLPGGWRSVWCSWDHTSARFYDHHCPSGGGPICAHLEHCKAHLHH